MEEDTNNIYFKRRLVFFAIVIGLVLLSNLDCDGDSDKRDKQHEKYTYLVDNFTPTASEECNVYRYKAKEIRMAGGESGDKGFIIKEEGGRSIRDIQHRRRI